MIWFRNYRNEISSQSNYKGAEEQGKLPSILIGNKKNLRISGLQTS